MKNLRKFDVSQNGRNLISDKRYIFYMEMKDDYIQNNPKYYHCDWTNDIPICYLKIRFR